MREAVAIFSLFSVLLGCALMEERPDSEPKAVSDGQLVLGLVPVVRYETQAYRLLICKKLHHYPQEVLEDRSNCRVALHDRDGNEVAFFSSDFQRSMVVKYKGYAKQVGAAVVMTVPLVLVGVLAGSWRLLKLAHKQKLVHKHKEMKSVQALKLSIFDQGKYSEALINSGVGRVGTRYYMQVWSEAATKTFDDIRSSADADAVKAKLVELQQITSSYRVVAEVRAMTEAKKTLDQLQVTSHEQTKQVVAKLKRGIVQRNGASSFSAKGTFSNNFFQMDKRLQSLFQQAEESESLETLQTLASEIELLAKDFVIKLPEYEKLYADASVLAIERSFVDFYRRFQTLQDGLAERKAILLADSRMRARVEAAHVRERSLVESAAAGGVGGAAGLGLLQALDRSIWGYEDRQLNRYWRQVFVTNDDFSNPHVIVDLPLLLHALADSFGYQVNSAALKL